MSIKNNITLFLKELAPQNCKLIAVSKTHPAERVQEAYDAGQRIFGENKVQEITSKYEVLPKDIQWHLIGHLQSNKVKYIAPFVALIHSVDSLKLLEEINKQGKKINRVISCLLQVHIAQEETKFGFDEKELTELFNSSGLSGFDFIKIEGLMGMATLTEDNNQIRNEFRYLKKLFEQLKSLTSTNIQMKELSMGMSSDYKIAIQEGSTMVRVGTAIFGTRNSTSQI
jgi:PLP dependent protein